MKSLYRDDEYKEITSRINALSAESQRKWGKMDVGQMCAHCAAVFDNYNGDTPPLKPNFIMKLFKGVIKKIVFGPQPYKKNSQTTPQFRMTEPKDFAVERDRLLAAIDKFRSPELRETLKNTPHPLFGTLHEDEYGWAMYKHLNHHLDQFGA